MSEEQRPIVDESLQIEFWPVGDLIPNPRNTKQHSEKQIDLICRMMQQYGWTNPVLMADGHILAGHGRLMAAKKLGLAKVPCLNLQHLTEEQRRAYIIADNRSAEYGSSWDLELLKQEIDDLAQMGFDTDMTGFDDDAYAELFGNVQELPPGDDADPDAAPEPKPDPLSVPGDLWILGPHRVYCGSSTAIESWDAVMKGEKADVCWTDPPYNVAYESDLAGKIQNDDMGDDDFRQFLTDAFVCYFSVMKAGAPIYVAHADTEGRNFRNAFIDAGFKLSGCLIWKKNSLVLGRSDFQWIHEPILYGWKEGAKHRWYGGRKLTTFDETGTFGDMLQKNEDGTYTFVIGENTVTVPANAVVNIAPGSLVYHEKPGRSAHHPTMKPVGLIEKQLRNSARPGDVVIDGFGGSGSTLMAAERMGMSARLIELDPKFVDVIVKRYQDYTGRAAVHAETGEPFPVKPGEGGSN